jgi:hypothetical protein
MPVTAAEIEQVIEQVREAAYRWDRENKLGEIVLIIGVNDRQVEERDVFKHRPVRRGRRGESVITPVAGS